MLDEMLGRLNTSANIIDIAHAFSLKKITNYLHFNIVIPSLKCKAPLQRIQIRTSIELLDEILDDMLVHLNISPNICKICWLKCWIC